MYTLTWLWVVFTSRCLGSKLKPPTTTEDWGQHLSAIFVSAAKCYGETFDSPTLHPSIPHTFAFFFFSLLHSNSSPHLISLCAKQAEPGHPRCCCSFVWPLLAFIHFSFKSSFSTSPTVLCSLIWIYAVSYYNLSFALHSFLRMMNIPFSLSEPS